MKKEFKENEPDVVLIGAGIMSATLGVILKELQPDITIEVFEKLDVIAGESTDAWNNAGTGHSAFCELNYTPELPDGSIDISKAVKIAGAFEVSLELWAYLTEKNYLSEPDKFIKRIPHISFVWGEDNVSFLGKRHKALKDIPLFQDMEYSEDRNKLYEWMPLVMEGRDPGQKLAATKMDIGTDVNFGALTRKLFQHLEKLDGVKIHLNHKVKRLHQESDNRWSVKVKESTTGNKRDISSKFVFIGAGGGSLTLLNKSGIPEAKGYGGFPVSGQWLRCKNPEIGKRHHAKVYGKAAVGSPPMSVPHLDAREIMGKQELLFGPFAGFTTKFLKEGSYFDLPRSVNVANLYPLIKAGISNIPLTKYLIDQVRQTPEERLEALREYYPTADLQDWDLEVAGKRVQVIKKDPERGGVLEFGTEVVCSKDGTIAALLGASPGASTAASIMIDLLNKCFTDKLKSEGWQEKLKAMIPSYGKSLVDSPDFVKETRRWSGERLKLQEKTVSERPG